ncbi:MAG: Holliday junction branch migration protein RuvA [Bacteroidales bacterium]|nr:Holliday junction branch migration protein RuvA [Bacteroidales bacterium]MCM1148233.1 Holliday junction branch migration protein RuvA [Bacteroidales bacterium]MCM1206936.1 Holliday junction branch migration protein RuvA [Bacillota bacterium]MCM1511190.1 Holliday junction branch migration protein RuvA [Clostridium sp.]
MIEYIKGELTELTPAMAVIEAGGVGYGLCITLNTYTSLQGIRNTDGNNDVKLYVHEQLVTGGRDDSFTLYGFSSRQERELYRLLITVNGVGGNTARMILSATTPGDLCNTIASGNEKMLKTVKGIGPKAAQRIILELRDKIVSLGITDELHASAGTDGAATTVNAEIRDEAVAALTALGFSPAPSAKAVTEILKENPDVPVEQVIKIALKMIK